MFVLTDFFIATPEEAAGRDAAKSPVLALPTVLGRGVDCERLLWLRLIVHGAFHDPRMKTLIPEIMRNHLPHYPSDINLPPDLVKGLAGLCDQHREQCAEQWASLEGWEAHGVTRERAATMFMDVADLAVQAYETGRGMYLWQCAYP